MKVSKFLSLLLVIVFLIGGFGGEALLDISNNVVRAHSDDYEWEELEDGTVRINNYWINGGDVVIPDKLGGMPVTTIGIGAFLNKSLKSVIIPDSVTTIGAQAFGSNSLTSVIIPDSVTTIGMIAFQDNYLTSVKLSNSLERIGWAVFQNNLLTSVTIPDSVKRIGDQAFEGNYLTRVTMPASVDISDGSNEMGNNIGFRRFYNSKEKKEGTYIFDNGWTGPFQLNYGDVTGSGSINVQDAIAVLRHIVGLTTLDLESQIIAKVTTGSGPISVQDAILILRYVVGLIDKFPVENK